MADIYKKIEEVDEYLRKAKIPNLPIDQRNTIEAMIMKGTTYLQIMNWAKDRGESLNGTQIKKHKDMMPSIAKAFPERTSYLSPQEEDKVLVPKKEYTTLVDFREFLETEMITEVQKSMRRDIEDGRLDQISILDKMNMSEKLVKLSRLMGGESTENIQAEAVVKHEDMSSKALDVMRKYKGVASSESTSTGDN